MVLFTKHSEEKLKTKAAKRLKITRQRILRLLDKPLIEEQLPKGIIRAVGVLDQVHTLCIVYKWENGIMKVITFFPAKKGRYEN